LLLPWTRSYALKLLFEVLAPLAFFVAYKLADIYVAAAVAMGIAIAQVVGLLLLKKRISPMLWTAVGFTVVFGAMTILLKDEFYIKAKWTLFYGLGGLLLLVFVWRGKNPMKALLGAEMELPDAAWRVMSLSWGWFFLIMAVLNTVFAAMLSLDAWVKVKVFGGMAASLVFVVIQTMLLSKYLPDDAERPADATGTPPGDSKP
jgi:intracellular septation protein